MENVKGGAKKMEIVGFEHLHQHTDSSLLDGLGLTSEYAELSKKINQKFLTVSDHGTMAAVPQQIAECENHKLHPIFAIEAYINPMQIEASCREDSSKFRNSLNDEEKAKFNKNHHILLIAHNAAGYRNLVKLSSWAWIHGFSGKPPRPRINWDMLQKNKNGLIATSGCCASETANAFFAGGDEAGFAVIEKYLKAFGDKFYLELMLLDFKRQKPYDAFLIRVHNKYNIPFIVSCDVHYSLPGHSKYQRLMLCIKSGKTVQDIQELITSGHDDLFELQDENLWRKSEEELNQKWESDYSDIIDYDIFKMAKTNTVKICEMAKGVELDRTVKLPTIPDEKQKLFEEIKRGIVERKVPRTKIYLDRINEEYNLICEKGFASYFLIEQNLIREGQLITPELYGLEAEYARGPARGSVGGSLVAYCLDIHDLDPIKHNLLFSRFLSPARGGKQMKLTFTIKPTAWTS